MMRLAEIEQPSAEQSRVDRMKDSAKKAKDRAKQLDAQADLSANQLKARQSQQKLQQVRGLATSGATKSIP